MHVPSLPYLSNMNFYQKLETFTEVANLLKFKARCYLPIHWQNHVTTFNDTVKASHRVTQTNT